MYVSLFVYNSHLNGYEVTYVLKRDSNRDCVSPVRPLTSLWNDHGYLAEHDVQTGCLVNIYFIVRGEVRFKGKAQGESVFRPLLKWEPF